MLESGRHDAVESVKPRIASPPYSPTAGGSLHDRCHVRKSPFPLRINSGSVTLVFGSSVLKFDGEFRFGTSGADSRGGVRVSAQRDQYSFKTTTIYSKQTL